MGFLKGSAPKSPDPYQTADAQWQASKKAASYNANINAVNQYGPNGSTTYKRNSLGVPTSQTVTLNPRDAAFLGQSRAIRSTLGNTAGAMARTPFSAPDDSAKIADTLYQRKLGMVSPQLDQAQKELTLQLTDRGIPIGSEVYNQEMDRLAKTRGDTLASISQDATLAGGQEQDRQLQYALTKRSQPFNELAAWSQGTPIQTPQFQNNPSYQVQAPDIAGQINKSYSDQLAAYNQQQSSLSNGLFGLGSAALGAFMHSDIRVKKDIAKVGKFEKGLNLYAYRYKDEPDDTPKHIGLMAQEVERVAPWAVAEMGDGYKGVDYGAAVEAMQ